MADKRISQLIERVDIANNDVLPIVASGATTTNKVTVSTLQDWMQDNLDVGVTSVGLSMPSAFVVSNSPVTGSGNISVTGAGSVSQYIRGDGSLADFPSGGGGGGSSVNYYLNGSVSQGTIGGIVYQEMNKVPVLGTGTDFTIAADGYIASFITDAGDPALLQIPAGNWNFETYLQASSGGGTPTFYIELYKVNSGGTATLIATSSATPELIAFGTVTTAYFSSLAVPETILTLTDRLALRYYVTHSGRTITLHTENATLCQIITTFTTGLTALNGLTAQVQNFATGTSGTNFAITSSVSTHTFNLPDASTSARGVVTTGAQNFAGNKSFQNTIFANAGVRLDQNGTALPTIVQNISGSGLITTGAIGVGFNNANNFFFAGSDKGCSVFVVNYTATRNYTLQDASGTLAFTSDISTAVAGYLPLTLTSTQRIVELNGQTLEVYSSANSFTSGRLIVAPTYGAIGYQTGGIFRGLQILTDGTAFLSNTGTLTMTGALSGTSASFSGGAIFYNGGNSFEFAPNVLTSANASGGHIRNVVSAADVPTYSFAGDQDTGMFTSGANVLGFSTGGVQRLSIASTGAATFSSSVGVGNATSTVTLNVNGKSKIGDSFNTVVGGTAGQLDVVGGSAANLLRLFDDNAPSAPRFIVERTGNVGIGTASPSGILHTLKSGTPISGVTDEIFIGQRSSTGQNAALTIVSDGLSIIRLTNSSNIELGKISYDTVSNSMRFNTNSTEAMRITSGGFLKASNDGTYNNSGASYHEFRNNANQPSIYITNTKTSGTEELVRLKYTAFTPNNSSNWFIYADDSTSARFYVTSAGGIGNFQANNVNLSDERTKKDIEPLESYWNKFKEIEIVKFKYKDQTHDDFNIGVIAQQVEAVAPEFVDVDGWGSKPEVDEEGNEIVSEEEPLKSIYTADLHHATIKVLQEAMAKIEKLETEIDSLKNQIQ